MESSPKIYPFHLKTDMSPSLPPKVSPTASLQRKLRAEVKRVKRKLDREQSGVSTYFDHFIVGESRRLDRMLNESARSLPDAGHLVGLLTNQSRTRKRRVVGWDVRVRESAQWQRLPWELTPAQMASTQGVDHCLTWRGHPLFKAAFDFALYPMLIWELKPATIIELGTGPGAGAAWLADITRTFGLSTEIVTVDINAPALRVPGVTYVQGDCRQLEDVGLRAGWDPLAHPLLVIEDMHVNTAEVLRYFWRRLRGGDYLVVEDSTAKRDDLAAFAADVGDELGVDTFYTDFFGRNMTSCLDSIFVKRGARG
jgi:cephalosporin hydroxylase